MKKFFKSKKWIAFFLALLLVVSTSITSSDAFLWATGVQEEEQVNGNAPVNDNETGKLVQQTINVSETDQQTPVTGEPQTPVTGEPQTPVTGEPQTPVTGEPQTPVTGEPQTPVTGEPQTPVTGEPQTPVTGEPQTPVTGEPQTPATGDQSVVEKPEEQPTEIEAEEEVLDEENVMDFALFGARLLADQSLSLTVGEPGKVTCSDGWALSHTWESENPAVATVDGSGNVTAVSAGSTVIRCYSYKILGGKNVHCQWYVEVASASKPTITDKAYGYIGFEGVTAENQSVVDQIKTMFGVGEPTQGTWNKLYEIENVSLPELTAEDIVNKTRYAEDNTYVKQVKGKLDENLRNMAKECALGAADGAEKYVGEGTYTWHFDVTIDVSNMYCPIKYVDQDGNEITNLPAGAPTKVWAPHKTAITETDVTQVGIPGYKPDSIDLNGAIVNKDTKTEAEKTAVTLKYKEEVNYNVNYHLQKEGDYPSDHQVITEQKTGAVGDKVTWDAKIPDTVPTGYVYHEGVAGESLTGTIAADGTTELNVYLKQQFTVKYEVNGKVVKEVGPLDYNAKTPTIVKPEMDGNAFVGWKEAGTVDSAIVDIENTPVTKDVTYVAVWTEGSNLYTYVKFIVGENQLPTNDGLTEEELEALEDYFGLDEKCRNPLETSTTGERWYPIGRIKNVPMSGPTGEEQTVAVDQNVIAQMWVSDMDMMKLTGTTEEIAAYKTNIWDNIGKWEASSARGADVFAGPDNPEAYDPRDPNPDHAGGKYVWHLNGSVDLRKSVSVEYVDESGTPIASVPNTATKTVSSAVFRQIATSDVVPGSIEGYRYTSAWIKVGESDQTKNKQQYSIDIADKTKDIAIVLQYEKTYQVTYKGGNGGYLTADNTKTEFVDLNRYAGNDTVTVEADGLFTNSDRVFAEWEAKDSNGTLITITNGTFTMPKDNVTVTAKWKGLTASKSVTSKPAEDGKYKLGEKITFNITVANSGDVDLTNVVVSEKLQGAKIEEVVKVVNGAEEKVNVTPTNPSEEHPETLASVTIGSLVAGETVVVKASYEVQEKDLGSDGVSKSRFVNEATIEAAGLTDKTISTGENEIPMDDVDEQLTVIKELVGETLDDGSFVPKGANGENNTFKRGDTAEFKITVTNSGNQTRKNITIAEALDGAVLEEAGNPLAKLFRSVTQKDDGSFVIDELKPGKSVEFKATYQIKDTDVEKDTADKAEFKNVLKATWDKNDGTPVEQEAKSDKVIPLAELYTLTVRYEYSNGAAASPEVVTRLHAGDPYTIATPAIAGYNSTVYYNSSITAVTGTMPGNNMVIRVVYTAPAAPGGGTVDTPATPPTTPEPVVVPEVPVPAGTIVVEVPADLVPVEDEEVPLQGARIDIDEDGNAEVVPIDEEEIPLAGIADSPVLHCILHFLLLLAAVLMFLYHMISTQRRQRKLDDMRDQLNGR